MKKAFATMAVLLASVSAFAGSGGGSVGCTTREGDIVAQYSWFHSTADSYSTLNVFVQDEDGNFKQLKAENEEALKALSVKADNKTITVAPNLKKGVCSIKVK